MGRKVAVLWHASFSLGAGALYFFFVLPRWPELSYHTSHTLGTVLRIVDGALIGLAALPVVFTWLRTRKPEYGTPQLALRLLLASVVFHVLAAALIIGTAISEIWLSLDEAGRWLFGIYGAAAAIFILGIFSFYLSFLAELPPPPPRPLKTKEPKQRRRRRDRKDRADKSADASEIQEDTESAGDDAAPEDEEDAKEGAAPETSEERSEEKPAEVTAQAEGAETSAHEEPAAEEPTPDEPSAEKPAAKEPMANEPAAGDTEDDEPTDGDTEPAGDARRAGLRNRRPATFRRRRRSRGGVTVED